VKRLVMTLAATTALALGSTGGASAAPTITLGQQCVDTPQYFNYDLVLTISGVQPGAAITGTLRQPDGHDASATVNADDNGRFSLTTASIFPGVFKVSVTEPFRQTKQLYIDCGRTFPTHQRDCRGRRWKRWDFENRPACREYVKTVRTCATLHYQGTDPPYCMPPVPALRK
jgi:hypothetical protein